jgi:hypothetical protein
LTEQLDEKLLEKLQNEYAKRLVAENTKEAFRAIIYRPDNKGGLQGARLDFFFEDQDGRIAHEFYKIGKEGELEMISSGIMKVENMLVAEKTFN